MKSFSFCVLIHNEGKQYLEKLFSIIQQFMTNDDELIVMDDYSTDKETIDFINSLKLNKSIIVFQHALNKDFATHKNCLLQKATKDYIWMFDADEYIELENMKKIKDIVYKNKDIDIFYLTRKNFITELNEEKLKYDNWIFDYEGKHDFPDYQGRIFKNFVNIRYYGKVHEQPFLINGKTYNIPIECDVPIIHIKTAKRQNLQHEFYETIK